MKKKAVLSYPILACALTALNTSCMPLNTGSGSITSLASGNTSSTQVAMAISPSGPTVSPGSSIQFVATGGSAPYSYAIITGSGTIVSTTGIYTAPSSITNVEIAATDATGATAIATVTVAYPPLVISPSTITLAVSTGSPAFTNTFTFSAAGGSGTYTFGMAYGAGTITSGGLYTAPTASSTDQILVYDSNGDESVANITVGTGGVISSGTNSACSLITALGDTAVQMSCDSGEILGTYGQSGTCGSVSQTGASGTSSYSVSCTGAATTATGNAYCCASPTRSAGSYSRTITASATTYVQLYCGVGETILSATATCTSATNTLFPTTLPNNSANQEGYSITCETSTDTAALSVICQGVAL